MGCLYQLESPSGKRYIGITSKSADERWQVHNMRVREGRNHALQAAIRKYGSEQFKRKTLVIADDWDFLCELERKAISAFKTRSPHGYNLTTGGEGVVGRVHTEKASRNMSAGQRRRMQNPVERERVIASARRGNAIRSAKCAAAREAKKLLKEERQQRARTCPVMTAESKSRHSQAVKTALARPEIRAKVLACAAKRAASPEWRQRVSASKRGQVRSTPYSPEERQRRSAGAKRMWLRRKELNGNST